MCSPHTVRLAHGSLWPLCQDDTSVQHFRDNPDITVGPDHDLPGTSSVTDGAGTFLVRRATRLEAMLDFLATRPDRTVAS